MPESADSNRYVKPFIYETPNTKALHFSICEIQSRMQTSMPDALDLDYTRTMMGFLLFKGAPTSVAMIGLGGGSLAKFCHRHLPDTLIKVVEINPYVIALKDEFKVPANDDRFKVRQGDGAEFIRFTRHRFDVLMVDGFDSDGQPQALCSQRFYGDCLDVLQPNGLMVVNLHAGHVDYKIHLARIRRSFGSGVLVVNDANCSNSIVFACKGHLLRQFKSAVLRKPKNFDGQAWDELKPALAGVVCALKRLRESS